MSSKRGQFIVFEGLDRAGKTTYAKQLTEYLQSRDCATVPMRFPDRTTSIGKMCSDYLTNVKELSDETIHLLFTANRHEKQEDITRALLDGQTVVCDRYSYSGVAYTYAKAFAKNRTLSQQWGPEVICAPELGLLSPDLVIFCNVSPSVAVTRGEYGQERYENKEFQQIIRQRYEELSHRALEAEAKAVPGPKWVDVLCDGTIEEVYKQIVQVVEQFREAHNPSELLRFTADNFGFLEKKE